MTRRFTDGEILAAIKTAASEGAPLSRASIAKRLGGGGSDRISGILKGFLAGAHDDPVRSGSLGQLAAEVPEEADAARAVVEAPDPMLPLSELSETDARVADLERQIRALQILLQSERQARREDAARHARTVDGLQREIARSRVGGKTT